MTEHTPLLVAIVTFGLIFVVTASLAQGFSFDVGSGPSALRSHSQLNVMLLISNFIVMPTLLIGLAALTDSTTRSRWLSSSWR